MIKLRQSPINQSESSIFMINHDIVRFHVAVHDSHAVAVVERPQQLVKVAPYVVVGKCLVKLLEVGVVDVLEYEGGSS